MRYSICPNDLGNCREGVTGRRCDMCLPLHYGFSSDGCKPCDCDQSGSTDMRCDLINGQCPCRNNIMGRKCNLRPGTQQSWFFTENCLLNGNAILVDCELTWSSWGPCDKKCGGGKKYRTKIIEQEVRNGGRDCPKGEVGRRDIKDCNEGPCPGRKSLGCCVDKEYFNVIYGAERSHFEHKDEAIGSDI